MTVYQTFIVLSVCIGRLYCIDLSKTSKTGINQTVCAGKESSFFCRIIYPFKVFIIIFVKDKNLLGTYTPRRGVHVSTEFRDRYSITKNNSGIILTINDTMEWDQGRFFCRITYDGKEDAKMEQHLIVKEREKSNLILFAKEERDFCTVLNCSAKGRFIKLKKPDNSKITDKYIVLNSCNSSLTDGEYSCCLLGNCSQDECKSLTLEVAGENSVYYWIIPAIIGSLVFMVIVVVRYIFKMRGNNNQNQMNIPHEEQNSLLMQINLPQEEQQSQPNQTNLSQEEEKSLPNQIDLSEEEQQSPPKKMYLPHEEQRSLSDLKQLRSGVLDQFEEIKSQIDQFKEIKSQIDLEQLRIRHTFFRYLSRQSKPDHLKKQETQPVT